MDAQDTNPDSILNMLPERTRTGRRQRHGERVGLRYSEAFNAELGDGKKSGTSRFFMFRSAYGTNNGRSSLFPCGIF